MALKVKVMCAPRTQLYNSQTSYTVCMILSIDTESSLKYYFDCRRMYDCSLALALDQGNHQLL